MAYCLACGRIAQTQGGMCSQCRADIQRKRAADTRRAHGTAQGGRRTDGGQPAKG